MRSAGVRVPLSSYLRPASELIKAGTEYLSTGLEGLDRLLGGGFPRGRITELVGSASSGKTGLLFSALARATCQGEVAGYVDTFDAFDPLFASRAGVTLPRLLWVRCGASEEKALKATDILVRAGGFGVVVMDLVPADLNIGIQPGEKIPALAWYRLQQTLQGSKVVLLVVAHQALTGSVAAGVCSLQRRAIHKYPGECSRPPQARGKVRLFSSLDCELRISRGKNHGAVTFCSGF